MSRRTARSHRHADVRPFPRVARLNAVVHEVVAEEIERVSDADERLAMLTVTDVVCEPDMRHAVVYLASLPEGSSEALEEHRRAIQSAVGSQTHMKRTPLLRFLVDPAIIEGNRVEDALRRAKRTSEGDGDPEGAS
jgi:ribosome-binding factor A